ncbi:zinc finger protein 239-like [Megalops cyprinoides]|uniref:zinc finger protein 239-like n=1 Tax=Megalops cyprinoides TaxID=118141 RepID=UPI001864AB8F|nr:zinc finger protein 239-like [Megalops cyprinoides]
MEFIGALNPALKKGPKHCTAWPDNPSPEYIMYERVTVLEEGDSDAEANGLDFSCTADQESEPRPVLIHAQHKLHGETKDREGIQIADVVSLSHPHNAVNQGRRKSVRKMKDGTSKPKQQQLGLSGKRAQMSVSGSASLVLSDTPEVGMPAGCGQRFAASMDIKSLHGLGAEDKHISCIYCGKSFSYASRLKIHLLKHTGEKPFSCTHCGKRFTIARNLERHQHIHWGDASFCCAQCGKRFKRADHLKVHQRVHTGERPYSCTQCNKSFRFSGDLNTHKRVHTGEKPYCCVLCGNRFSQLRQLKSHQRKHKGLSRFDQLIK